MKAFKWKDIKEFLEKRWWLGVGVIVAIVGVVFVVLQFVGTEKPEDTVTQLPEREEEAVEIVPERQRVFLPDENKMWELNIDNPLLTKLHDEAHAEARENLHDATLTSILIYVYPYNEWNRVSIVFTFYSEGADKVCIYEINERKDMHLLGRPIELAISYHQATFKELPWIKSPFWLQFIRESYERASPFFVHERTRYVLDAYAMLGQRWHITFKDGVTEKESSFYWYGKGAPVLEE